MTNQPSLGRAALDLRRGEVRDESDALRFDPDVDDSATCGVSGGGERLGTKAGAMVSMVGVASRRVIPPTLG